MSKFQTIDPALIYNKKDDSVMPEWMKSLGDTINNQPKSKIDLQFDKRGAFADSACINRTELNATPRDIIADGNHDRLIIESKIELAKFLKGKYYKTAARIAGNKIYMDTTIDGLQAAFTFEYNYENGKIHQGSTFVINDSEYPFSRAGFVESLSDLKSGSLKKSTNKIASTRQTFVINREEIVRRYNGHLRQATEAINKNLSDGIIVGVGSNSYASYYNPDELFPQVEKEKPQLPDGSFDFVNNAEHVATNEYKSAKKLSFEASKIMSGLFSDYYINNSQRDNNELLINATVLNSDNIRHTINFNFSIENEKVASLRLAEINDERMTIPQLMDKLKMHNNLVNDYLKTAVASNRIHKGIILTNRDIKEKLSSFVNSNKINDIVSGWISTGSINPLGNSTYVSNYTLPELLGMITCESLSNEERQTIIEYKKSFGSGMDFDRIEQDDTELRELDGLELTSELKLLKINSELSKSFKNYQITGFKNDIINTQFIKDGVRNNIKLIAKFNGRKLEKLNAIINNNEININQLAKAFKVNPLLNNYLQTATANNSSTHIISSETNLLNRLAKLTSEPEIVLSEWKSKYLQNIGSNIYTSQYSFEELLNKTTAKLLSDYDRQQILIAQQHFGNAFDRIDEDDTGIRDMESRVNNETLLYEANKILSENFANYSPKYFEHISSTDNNNVAKYKVALFDDTTGLSTDLDFVFWYNGNKPTLCKAIINDQELEISNIKKAFAMNEALSRYLQTNTGKKFNAPMVITKNDLFRKISSITNAANNEIENIISKWQQFGKVHQLNENTYASKCSLEQLIAMSNIKPLSDDEITEKLNKSRRDKYLSLTSNYINDSDTRRPEDVWSNEKMALHGRATIGNMFADFDIIDAELNNSDYIITARIINPINGLKQSLSFKFDTFNGTKLGELECISNGEKSVSPNNILEILNSSDSALNKFISINSVVNKNYKNIISKSNLCKKLSGLINPSNYSNIVNKLIEASILNPIDGFNYASENSLPEIIEYLSFNKMLDLKTAENLITQYSKDSVVNTNVPITMDSDSRKIEKPIETLSPKMIETAAKIKLLIKKANEDKKITNNKYTQLFSMLDVAKSSTDVDNVWRELKKYL